MKVKMSISINEDTAPQVQEFLRKKTFRNKSHFFEIAATELMEHE